MNSEKKYTSTIVILFILILILAFSYWYFALKPKTGILEGNTSQTMSLTDQQKLDILSATSNASIQDGSEVEKRDTLNKLATGTNSANVLSEEEKFDILNGGN